MFLADKLIDPARANLQNQLDHWLGNAVGANVLPPQPLHPDSPAEFINVALAAEAEPASSYIFGETFTIYFLDPVTAQSAESKSHDLSQLAQPADRRYHQLRYQGQPIAYAHSIPSSGDEVCQLMVSNYAQHVGRAMKRLDEIEKTNEKYAALKTSVRMLAVQAFNVTAFWIYDESVGESDILVISAPSSMTSLQTNDLMNSSGFLEAFAKEPPIRGLA